MKETCHGGLLNLKEVEVKSLLKILDSQEERVSQQGHNWL